MTQVEISQIGGAIFGATVAIVIAALIRLSRSEY